MDTSIRDTEGRAPLYLYYEHCYGPFVDREDARRLYEKYPLKIPSVEDQIDPHSWWKKLPSFELRTTIISIVTTLQIMVLERLYLKLAEKMTDSGLRELFCRGRAASCR